MAKTGTDKRQHPRSRRGFIGIKDAARPGILNFVDNISCSGILCHTAEAVPIMTKLSMVIELPPPFGDEINTEGVVVRCDPEHERKHQFNVAILFNNLSDDDYLAIKRYVEADLVSRREEAHR